MDLPSPINTPDQILIRELQKNADEIERYRVLLTKCLDRISLLELHKNEILTNYMKNRHLPTNNYRENLSIKIEENQSVAQLINACRQNSASVESIQQALTSLPSSKGCQFHSPGSINKSESSSGTSMGQLDQYHINQGKLVIDEELGYQNDLQIKKEILDLPILNNGNQFCLSKNSKSDSALVSNYCTSHSSRTRTPCALQQNVANVVPKLADPTNVLNLLSSAGMAPIKTNVTSPFLEELPVSAGESDQLKNVQQNIKMFFAQQQNNSSFSRRNSLDVGPQRKVPRLAEPQSLNLQPTQHLDSMPTQLPKLELPFHVQHSNQMFHHRARNHSNKHYRRIDPKNRTDLQTKAEVEHWMQRDPITNFHHCRFPGCNNNEKKGFSLKLRCKTHIEAEHLQIRYQCPYCSFQTARDDNLPKHIDKKHKEQQPQQPGFSGFSLLAYN